MRKRSAARQRPSTRRGSVLRPRVEAVEPRRLLATLTVNTTGAPSDATKLTLQQAVAITNGTLDPTTLDPLAQQQISGMLADPNTIGFAIPGGGVQTINLTSTLSITKPVTIDGYTQFGSSVNTSATADNAVLLVQLELSSIYSSPGIEINSNHVTVRGLVVGGSQGVGIQVDAGFGNTDNVIAGNFIGTDATGTVANPNAGGGIVAYADQTTIGGISEFGERNLISGNLGDGVLIDGEFSLGREYVYSNLIGVNAAATAPLANSGNGINVQSSSTTIQYNVIGGNLQSGILLNSSNSSFIAVNSIGTDQSHTLALGNGGDGITAITSNYAIIFLNVIAANAGNGITIGDSPTDNAVNNLLTNNTIINNGKSGIDLGNDGVTPNTPGGPHTGPNLLQNYPVLTSAYAFPGETVLTGTFNSAPNATYSLEFFIKTSPADTASNREGGAPIDLKDAIATTTTSTTHLTVTTDALGNATFTAIFPENSAPTGSYFSATATDSMNNTSEFSADFQVSDALLVTNTSNSGPGSLFQAITNANTHPGADTIGFKIPGAGVHVIAPFFAPLPALTGPTILDATSQPGYAGTPLIQLDGSAIPTYYYPFADGLALSGSYSRVSGLSVTHFTGNGIRLLGSHEQLTANYVGLAPNGTATGNGLDGLLIQGSSDNIIGGPTNADGNAIGGNAFSGIGITDSGSASGFVISQRNLLSHNRIGTDPTGLLARPNAQGGILVEDNAAGTAVVGNVLSGNTGIGLNLSTGTTGSYVTSNLVGVGADGVTHLGNSSTGIYLGDSSLNNVSNNVVATNGGDGISLYGDQDTGNYLTGNFIGVDATGLRPLGNLGDGISLLGAHNNAIGVLNALPNILGDNRGMGIRLSSYTIVSLPPDGSPPGTPSTSQTYVSHDNFLASNLAGRSATLAVPGNGGSGILLADGSHDNSLVGNFAGNNGQLNNTGDAGIEILGSSNNTLYLNTISDNLNLGLAIVGGSTNNQVVQGSVTSTYGVGIGVLIDGEGTAQNALTGLSVSASQRAGVQVSGGADGNSLGDSNPGQGLSVTGNYGPGVLLTGIGTDNNYVVGSFINGNVGFGVKIEAGASRNSIGFLELSFNPSDIPTRFPGNVISGNYGVGVGIAGAATVRNVVQANLIGLDYFGNALGNLYDGLAIFDSSHDNHIGVRFDAGPPPASGIGEANVISGNGRAGVRLGGTDPNPGATPGIGNAGLTASAAGNEVTGNRIGTDPTGTVARPNAEGIQVLAPGEDIGFDQGNLISGNLGDGVHFLAGSASDTIPKSRVVRNLIGAVGSSNALSPLPNRQGIEFDAGATGLVGITDGGENTIAFNLDNAVLVNANAVGVTILSNRIFSNGFGIRLDPAVPVSGNNAQPAPVLNFPSNAASGVLLSGTVRGAANSQLLVQVFTAAAAAPLDAPQGQTFLANLNVTTDASGLATFQTNLPSSDNSQGFTATSTDLNTGNTSQFAVAVAASLVQFASASSVVTDQPGGTTAHILVNRTGGLGGTATVSYTTADGTATAGVDYTAEAGTLTFAPGVATQTIDVPILDSLLLGPVLKTFSLALTSPMGSARLGPQFSTVVTIIQANSLVVTNTNDDGAGSLRRAIAVANAPENFNGVTPTVTFAIPGAGSHTIQPLSPLPNLTYPVIIDGFSQPGSSRNTRAIGIDGPPEIVLDGSLLPRDSGASGLILDGGSSVVQGLAIGDFPIAGIVLEFAGGNIVRGNFLGTDQSGTVARPNGKDGVYILDSSNNLIGGPATGDRNLISGNVEAGVLILGNEPVARGLGLVRTDAAHNVVTNNYVGTNASGFGSLANGLDGVFIQNASANVIGVPGGLGGNLISGNGSVGVQIFGSLATGNQVQSNLIGANASGTAGLGNRADGVYLNQAPGNLIGGASPGLGNYIVANGFSGVDLYRANTNAVQGNFIGILPNGFRAGNSAAGVLLDASTRNTIGGPGSAANTLASNGFGGIQIVSGGQLIVPNATNGNTIGPNVLLGNTSPAGRTRVQGSHPRGVSALLALRPSRH